LFRGSDILNDSSEARNRSVRLEVVGQDRPKQNPALAIELHHLELLVDAPIIRIG
jgi:hypothetical protein